MPVKVLPMSLTFSRFESMFMNTPTTANRSRNTDTSRLPSEAIHAVMVVPMLAPMMMEVAWKSVRMPAFTRPTTMTVVADEL